MQAYLAIWLAALVAAGYWPARTGCALSPTGSFELRFQNDELDNSTIIKRPSQPLVLKCQAKLVRKLAAAQEEESSDKSNITLAIDWLKDELALVGDQVNVITVELPTGSSAAKTTGKPAAKQARWRAEIKNTLNQKLLKLSSRLKLNRLRAADSGRYRCRARATLSSGAQLSLDSNGPELLVSSRAAAEQALSSKTERKSIASSGARSSTLDRIIAGNEWQQSGSGAGAATTMVAGAAAAKPDPLRPPDGGRHASLPAHIESQGAAFENNGRSSESDKRNNDPASVELAPLGADDEWTSSSPTDDSELSLLSGTVSSFDQQPGDSVRVGHFESAKLSIAEMVHRIAPELSCYVGSGDTYRGRVALSADSQVCLAWAQVAQLAPALELDELELDHNYCRNLNRDPLGPWCYVRDTNNSAVLVRRPCKLSACSDSFWIYLVAPPLFLLSVLFCLGIAALRSIQRAYGRRSLFATSKRGKTFPSKIGKLFALGGSRGLAAKSFCNANRKPACGNYLDDDVFEIVHDIDWSDGSQLNSTSSPKSTTESLRLNSSISSAPDTDPPSCKSVNHAPMKSSAATSGGAQQASLADLLGAIGRPSPQAAGPMFATLRCQMRANRTTQRLLNQNQNKSTSTFIGAELSGSSSHSYSEHERQLSSVDADEDWLVSASDSAPKQQPDLADIVGEQTDSCYIHACKLPQLDASSVTLALDQALLYESKFSQVHLAYIRTGAGDSARNDDITAGRVGTQVAVNCLKPLALVDAALFDPDQLRLRNLNHLNLLKLVGFLIQGPEAPTETNTKIPARSCALVYDMSQLVDLSDWLKQQSSDSLVCKQPGEDVSLRQNLTCFAKQIALALDYLHDRSIIFKDLACRNCFLDPTKMLVKLATFNLEPVMRSGETIGQTLKSMIRPKYLPDYYVIDSRPSECQLLPLSWIPLESILFNKFNKQTDIWSYGCLIYELFSLGEVAYFGYSSKQVIDAVRANLVPPKPLLCPNGIFKLMSKCLSDIPNFRPNIKQIYEQLNLYGGQCSSFLDHHLCLLTPSVGDRVQYEDQTSNNSYNGGRSAIQLSKATISTNNSISKTKSHANIQAFSCRDQQASNCSDPDCGAPGVKKPSRSHELNKMPNSRSINLTTLNRLNSTFNREESSFVVDDVNQYDEPQVEQGSFLK